MSIPIFIAVGGQRDNIGDTVLRRRLLDVLRRAGELHLTTGSAPLSYVAGLGLQNSDVVYDDRKAWRTASLKAIGRQRTAWAFHTGELTMSAAVVRSYISMAPLNAYLRLAGGVGVHTGLGLRTASSGRFLDRMAAIVVGATLIPCSVVTWRDDLSARRTRNGTVAPDWAFMSSKSTQPESRADRTLLSVSIRHDRPGPSDAYVDAVKLFAHNNSLQIVMVAQTERDLGPAREHAGRFGAHVAEWASTDLASAEEQLRSVYRRTAVAVSNRLHGYVISGTEGAIPVGITMGTPEKLNRTLAAAGLTERGLDSLGMRSKDIYSHIEEAVNQAATIRRGFEAASDRLELLSDRIVRSISQQPKTEDAAVNSSTSRIRKIGDMT